MKKGIFSFVFAICCFLTVFLSVKMPVAAETSGDFSYKIENGVAYIGAANKSIGGDLVIPAEINGYKVAGIKDHGFYQCTNLTSVVVSEGIESIGMGAFRECSGIRSAVIPDSVTTVEYMMFLDCSRLTTVTIGKGMTKIPGETFANCIRLKEVIMSDSITSIGDSAFSGCKALQQITLSKNLESINGSAFYGSGLVSIEIPEKVYYIGGNSFATCSSLEQLILHEGLKTIEKSAFLKCTALKKLVIPDSVTYLGDYPFEWCSSLESVTIGDGVTIIPWSCFEGCTNLKIIEWGSSIELIDRAAFKDCNSLTSVVIPDHVKSINGSAFGYCESLREVTISSSITYVSADTFSSVPLTSVVVPEKVSVIDARAFGYNDQVTRVYFPKTLQTIGVMAFDDCPNITDVYFEGSEEEWNEYITIENFNDAIINATKHFDFKYLSLVNKFKDLAGNEWFCSSIEYVNESGLMTGMDASHFGPYSALSRAQFATILYRMNGTPEVEYEPIFDDIHGDEWYVDAVLWAYENGVVTGYMNGCFGPADMITREQMAVMMYRYANFLDKDTNTKADINGFLDAQGVSGYAVDAMKWAVGNSIITGKNNGTILDPGNNTSRAECAAIIQRYMSKF